MQARPQNLAYILEHAARVHGDQEIVSATGEGGIHRYSYRDALARTRRLANALRRGLGIEPGDRVATLAWNGFRHFEAWYAIAGQGAICHTVNPRLFPEQIAYILNHAGDRVVLIDIGLLPALERVWPELEAVEAVVVMTDAGHMSDTALDVLCYESLLAAAAPDFDWPELPEATPSSLCYTSGTTGHPKGVAYTHRSNLLMAYAVNSADGFALSALSSVLMVVPMFHANSWGLVYAAPMVGARLVLPGPHLDGASLHGMIEAEQVTFSAAVPTVWTGLLHQLEATGGALASLDEVVIGGSAVPQAMIETFAERYGVAVRHAWGMTETSPIGTVNRPTPATRALPEEAQRVIAAKQGRPLYGVEMRLVDDDGAVLPNDGETPGRLMVRGPWVVDRYYREEQSALDAEGWFDTGDIATIDPHGFMHITDRAKDVIKSGGEWISSVMLENCAMGHPEVALAAVIGLAHPKWGERPLLVVQAQPDTTPAREALIAFVAEQVLRWWVPDDVVFVDAIPLAATGKIDKRALRARFEGYSWPKA